MKYFVLFKAFSIVEANSPEEAKKLLDAEMPDTYANGEHLVSFDHEYEVLPLNQKEELQ